MSYTFSLSRRSLPVRCLCLLLIVLVLWCFFMVPRAGAVAVEAATVAYAGALVGTILVGAGVVFSSHGDMQKVGAAMYKSWIHSSNAIGSKISAIAAWAVEHGEAAAKGALRIGKDLWQGIVDAFKISYSNGTFAVGSDLLTFDSTVSRLDGETAAALDSFNARHFSIVTFSGKDGLWKFVVSRELAPSGDEYCFLLTAYLDGVKQDTLGTLYGWYGSPYLEISPYSGARMRLQTWAKDGSKYSNTSSFIYCEGKTNSVLTGVSGIPVSMPNDLVYPSDSTLVRMPDIPSVDTDTGEAVFPSDAAYTKDAVSVPYPTDADGVKVPDIPYDKVVDQSTGKTLDDTDTGTDTDKPGTDTDTGTDTGGLLGQIVALLKNFFDSPSDFRLNMDGFRNLAIKDKFPFCIPFDMVDSVKQFAANAADYEFRINLQTQYFSVNHVVDLTPLAVPLAFFRYIVVTWFVWVLLSRTRDLMKW